MVTCAHRADMPPVLSPLAPPWTSDMNGVSIGFVNAAVPSSTARQVQTGLYVRISRDRTAWHRRRAKQRQKRRLPPQVHEQPAFMLPDVGGHTVCT